MRKITCLVLSLCIFFGGLAPCYAAEFIPVTGSAFGVGPGFKSVSSITATGDTYSYTRYYYNSSNTISSSSRLAQDLGGIAGDITYSIAYSAQGLANRLYSALSGNTSSVSYYYDPTTSDNGQSINFSVSSPVNGFAAIVNQIAELLKNDFRFTYKFDSFVSYFMPNSIDYTSNDWKQYRIWSLDRTTGVMSNTLSSSDSFVIQLKALLQNISNQVAFSNQRVWGFVMDSSYDSATYNSVTRMSDGSSVSILRRSLWADIRLVNTYLTQLGYRITGDPINNGVITKYDNTTISADKTLTLKQYLYLLGENISGAVGRLAFVLANDQDIALRNNTADQVSAFTSNFTSSGSSTKVSAGDIGTMASGVAELKSGFSSSANASDAFRGFSTSGQDERWNWFSQDILNSLDTTSSNNRSLKSNNDFTNFTSQYYNEVMKYAD